MSECVSRSTVYMMVICGMCTQQRRQPLLIIGLVIVYGFTNLYAHVIGVITPVVLSWECFCLLSAQCVNLVCNEGNVVQLPAPYITLSDCLVQFLKFLVET